MSEGFPPDLTNQSLNIFPMVDDVAEVPEIDRVQTGPFPLPLFRPQRDRQSGLQDPKLVPRPDSPIWEEAELSARQSLSGSGESAVA